MACGALGRGPHGAHVLAGRSPFPRNRAHRKTLHCSSAPAAAADTKLVATIFAPNDTYFEGLLEELNKTAAEVGLGVREGWCGVWGGVVGWSKAPAL